MYTEVDAQCDKLYGQACRSNVDCSEYTVNSIRPVLCTFKKKLSYRRGTARRAVSVKTVLNVAPMFVELHLISPALGE